MLKVAILLSVVVVSLASDMLYLDELEDIVPRSDRDQVRRLEEDDYTPRSQIKVQRDQILSRQTQTVQDQFNRAVQMKESQRAAARDYQRSQAQTDGVMDVWQQIQNIDEDMSLSENEADNRKRQLKNQLGYGQRRALGQLYSHEDD